MSHASPVEPGSVGEAEALVQMYEGILSGTLSSWGLLKEHVRALGPGLDRARILEKGFRMLRQLQWGFFRDLASDTHPGIWRQLVVADPSFPRCGELKRFAAIPNTFLALVDIHGYTRFCREARNNASKVDLLDRIIQEDVGHLCAKAGVLNRRVRGDEILILGASALDVLEAIHRITGYFSGRKRIDLPEGERKDASHAIELPEFQLSAGIAGGQKYASLVVTREGDLSGDIVNSAARLQARANKISPDRNRVLVTNQVWVALSQSGQGAGRDLLSRYGFFTVGEVDFKGMSIGVYDLVALPGEEWRMGYLPVMETLLQALEKGAWKQDILEYALQLASRLSIACPGFLDQPEKRSLVTNLTRQALMHWHAQMYEAALDGFDTAVDVLVSVGRSDDVVMEYLLMVRRNYGELRARFTGDLDAMIAEKPPLELEGDKLKVFLTLQKHAGLYAGSRDSLRLKHARRNETWTRACQEMGDGFRTSLHSPK